MGTSVLHHPGSPDEITPARRPFLRPTPSDPQDSHWLYDQICASAATPCCPPRPAASEIRAKVASVPAWPGEDYDTLAEALAAALAEAGGMEWSAWGSGGFGQSPSSVMVAEIRLAITLPRRWLAAWGDSLRVHHRLLRRDSYVVPLWHPGPAPDPLPDPIPTRVLTEATWLTSDLTATMPISDGDLTSHSDPLEGLPSDLPTADNHSISVHILGPAYYRLPELVVEAGFFAREETPAFGGYAGTGAYRTETLSGAVSGSLTAGDQEAYLALYNALTAAGPSGTLAAAWLSPYIGTFWGPNIPELPRSGLLSQTNTTRTISTPDGVVTFTLSEPIDPAAAPAAAAAAVAAQIDAGEGIAELSAPRAWQQSSADGLTASAGACRFHVVLHRPHVPTHGGGTVDAAWRIWTLDLASHSLTYTDATGEAEWLSYEEELAEAVTEPSTKALGPYTLTASPGQLRWIEPLPPPIAQHYHPAPLWERL